MIWKRSGSLRRALRSPASCRRGRGGFWLLDLVLLAAVAGAIYLVLSEGLLGYLGIGWSPDQLRTLKRIGARGAPTLLVFTADW